MMQSGFQRSANAGDIGLGFLQPVHVRMRSVSHIVRIRCLILLPSAAWRSQRSKKTSRSTESSPRFHPACLYRLCGRLDLPIVLNVLSILGLSRVVGSLQVSDISCATYHVFAAIICVSVTTSGWSSCSRRGGGQPSRCFSAAAAFSAWKSAQAACSTTGGFHQNST